MPLLIPLLIPLAWTIGLILVILFTHGADPRR
nr:MAG TPA: hypothetical protein [Caudoviricetes sp.]